MRIPLAMSLILISCSTSNLNLSNTEDLCASLTHKFDIMRSVCEDRILGGYESMNDNGRWMCLVENDEYYNSNIKPDCESYYKRNSHYSR